METKKAKVTKVTRLDKQDSYGNTTFIIEFENADRGFYTTQKPEQDKFIVGNVADYEIEKKTGSKGQDYYKIMTPKPADGGGPKWSGSGRNQSKPQRDPKEQCASFACAYTKDLVIGEIVTMDEFEKTFERLYKLMASKFLQ